MGKKAERTADRDKEKKEGKQVNRMAALWTGPAAMKHSGLLSRPSTPPKDAREALFSRPKGMRSNNNRPLPSLVASGWGKGSITGRVKSTKSKRINAVKRRGGKPKPNLSAMAGLVNHNANDSSPNTARASPLKQLPQLGKGRHNNNGRNVSFVLKPHNGQRRSSDTPVKGGKSLGVPVKKDKAPMKITKKSRRTKKKGTQPTPTRLYVYDLSDDSDCDDAEERMPTEVEGKYSEDLATPPRTPLPIDHQIVASGGAKEGKCCEEEEEDHEKNEEIENITHKSYFDDDGNEYHLDYDGQPYYLDADGNGFYVDDEGHAYYYDQDGIPYYLDENGEAFYIDDNGAAYYVDQETGERHYWNADYDEPLAAVDEGKEAEEEEEESAAENNPMTANQQWYATPKRASGTPSPRNKSNVEAEEDASRSMPRPNISPMRSPFVSKEEKQERQENGRSQWGVRRSPAATAASLNRVRRSIRKGLRPKTPPMRKSGGAGGSSGELDLGSSDANSSQDSSGSGRPSFRGRRIRSRKRGSKNVESKTSEEHERAKGGRGRAGRSGGDASSGSSPKGAAAIAIAIATLVIRKQRETALILFLVRAARSFRRGCDCPRWWNAH